MLRSLLLTIAVCTDSFASAAGIGCAGIKIPIRSAALISFVGTLILTLSAAASELLVILISDEIFSILSFLMLMALGIFNLFQNFFKKIIFKNLQFQKNKNSPAKLFFDGTAADADNSKSISASEALVLSVALSADSVITGISSGSDGISLPLLSAMCFSAGTAAILIGRFIGEKLRSALKINLCWLSGAVLIVLAFLR